MTDTSNNFLMTMGASQVKSTACKSREFSIMIRPLPGSRGMWIVARLLPLDYSLLVSWGSLSSRGHQKFVIFRLLQMGLFRNLLIEGVILFPLQAVDVLLIALLLFLSSIQWWYTNGGVLFWKILKLPFAAMLSPKKAFRILSCCAPTHEGEFEIRSIHLANASFAYTLMPIQRWLILVWLVDTWRLNSGLITGLNIGFWTS